MITTAQNNINWADPAVVAQYNLLTPINVTDSRDLFQKSVVSIVQISPNAQEKDVYPQKGGGFSLSKTGLMKISAAAGMQTSSDVKYIDKDEVIMTAKASYTDYSGQQREGSGIKAIKRNQEFAIEKAESGAILRAIRGLLAIKTSYTQVELQKPFAIPHSVYAPNYADPQVKQVALQKFAQEKNILFGESSESTPQLEAPKTEIAALPEQVPSVQPTQSIEATTGEVITPAVNHPTPVVQPAPVQQVVVVNQPAPTQPNCKVCNGATKLVEGVGKTGKPYKAWACAGNCENSFQFINEATPQKGGNPW